MGNISRISCCIKKDVKVKEAEIKALKEEIVKTQKETNEWKTEFKVTIENITKAVLEQVTESLVNVVNMKIKYFIFWKRK